MCAYFVRVGGDTFDASGFLVQGTLVFIIKMNKGGGMMNSLESFFKNIIILVLLGIIILLILLFSR